jgi:hypothetical protein
VEQVFSHERDSTTEGDLLKLAKEIEVIGTFKWLHYKQITINGALDTIAHLRSSVEFGTHGSSRAKPLGSIVVRSPVGLVDGFGNQHKQYHNLVFWTERKRDEGFVNECWNEEMQIGR